jgi:hypothetical protein
MIRFPDIGVSSLKGESKAVPLHAVVAHGGEKRYSSYSFLTSALDGGEWSASRPGWVGPSTGLDAGARRKTSAPVGDRTSIVQPIVRHYTA